MLLEYEGQTVDRDPAEVALEQSILRSLRRRGPLRQKDLFYRSAGQSQGREAFLQAIDRLVQAGLITREVTNYKNSFILRMAPDKRRRERALTREQRAKQVEITEPLTPEVA